MLTWDPGSPCCPFRIDMRVATALMAGFIYLPRTTRLAVDTLAMLAGADLLQFGYSWLQDREQSLPSASSGSATERATQPMSR